MTRTIRDYKPEALSLWARLVSAGFTIRGVSNDGETMIKADGKTQEELIDELLGADEGWLYVTTPSTDFHRKATLYLVYGNEPGVIVCDHTAIPEIEDVVNAHWRFWEHQEQPTLAV